ncbi:PP2C family serine/threonine-protein phosphatase [Streptomyces sp. NPDC096339]|uniref:PP2C family serine/threonine-protein phosphatase n=1 Tax=Streptomyces sp. NPDC096339 TaxID=3366086 RepID=UPI0037FE69F5
MAAGPDTEAALVPDTVLDGATAGRLTVRAGSVRGDAHRYHAEPRQDSLAVARLGGPDHELLLLAVADGVGSARRSHAGSRIVCHEIVRQLEPLAGHLADFLRRGEDKELTGLVNSAVGSAAESLAQSAAGLGHRPDDYATTLRVLLVPVDPAVRTRAFFAVGDGGTLRLREGGWVPLFPEEEQSGSGAGIIDTRTAALPSTRYAQVRLIHDALPGDVIVLCTDGVSNPLAGDGEMREFLRDSWAGGPPGLADFLWQLQYRVKSYDDDRTAVCLWEEESA